MTFGEQLILGFEGHRPHDPEVRLIRDCLKQRLIGGVILFGRNIQDPIQLQELIQSFQEANPSLNPWISIDQEGGAVQRLKSTHRFRDYPSAWDVTKHFSPAQATNLYYKMAFELKRTGINLNFGPVVDLTYEEGSDKSCPVIGARNRSYGFDETKVEHYGRAFVEGHRQAGVVTCLKHYPGHGLSLRDSHEGFVDITATYQDREEKPFQNLAQSGHADMIMMAHLKHQAWDAEYPASFSIPVMQKLRTFYDGVTISDDFHMGAVVHHYPWEVVIHQALKSGLDLFIFANHHGMSKEKTYFQNILLNIEKIHDKVKFFKDQDPGLAKSLNASYERLSKLKEKFFKQNLAVSESWAV